MVNVLHFASQTNEHTYFNAQALINESTKSQYPKTVSLVEQPQHQIFDLSKLVWHRDNHAAQYQCKELETQIEAFITVGQAR